MSSTRPAELSADQVSDPLCASPSTRLIDVRTASEFEVTRIPGSFNVPLDVIQAHGAEWRIEHDDPIVLVCGSGVRAEQAQRALEPAGLSTVVVLGGGISEWPDEVEHRTDQWDMVRQARMLLGLLILLNLLVVIWFDPAKWFMLVFVVGLILSALTNDCGVVRMLSFLPYNRRLDGRATLAALTASDVPGRPLTPRQRLSPGRARDRVPERSA